MAELRKEKPEEKLSVLIQLVAEMWQRCSDDEKKPFSQMETQIVEEEEIQQISKKPKRSLGSFMMFVRERKGKIQEENPNIRMATICKKLGQQWRELEEEEKQVYKELAAKESALNNQR